MIDEDKPKDGQTAAKILAFDSAKDRSLRGVDLDAPFFSFAQRDYAKCDHRNRGVELDISTRQATCLCGVVIDSFDALLIYAHAQQRMQYQADAIKEHKRKQAEKDDLKPFHKHVTGWSRLDATGRHFGFTLTMECGHRIKWLRKRAPRTATCRECFGASRATLAEVSRTGAL